MIKVLIVEDERHTARYISQLVEQHPDFTVVGAAANGAEGLSFFEKHDIDFVITDIRMPVMDGIELLRHIHAMFPDCITAVLSGYSDFDYAKAAIHHQALDYLLKPVDKDELFTLLDKVKVLWLDRTQSRRRSTIQQALDGTLLPGETMEEVYLLLTRPNRLEPETVFGPNVQVFTGAAEQLLVLENDPEVPKKAARYLDLLRDTPTQVLCTQTAIPLWSLQTAAENLRAILPQKAEMFRSDLFLIHPMETQTLRGGTYMRDMHPDRAVDAICTRRREDLKACLTEVLEIPGILRMDMQNYLDAVISDTRLAYHMPPAKLSRIKLTFSAIIAEATDPAVCAQRLTTHLMALQNEPEAKRDIADLVEEIAQHMYANCHLPFTTESLAKQYGLMPRYLNKVFKEHKGVRPMEYLLTLRMNQAREMLENAPDALIKDIAIRVGYTDPLYFSKIFKRETGLWPKEVQQTGKK